MTFSTRVQHLEAEGAYAVLAQAQALERQGRNIVHLEIGQPDFPTFPHISEAGIDAIRRGRTRYTPPNGTAEFREVIAREAGARRGIEIHPDGVVVAPGTKPGLFFPTLALVEPGDEVIFPDPGFPTYAAVTKVTGGVPVPIPLREENSFSFDLDVFDARINDRTRVIFLNSPANPTGGVIPLDDLKHIAEKAAKHNAWIISDEIYARLVYDGGAAPSIAALDGMLERTVIVDGFSKTYAMTGWRLGFMVAPPALAHRLELLVTHSTGCTATFTQDAGMAALGGPQDAVDAVVIEYQRRRNRLLELVNAIPGVHARKPEGAFYVFPNVKSFGIPSKELARRILNEAGVAVLSGTDFGPGGEGYLRIAYATSMEQIEEGMSRLAAFFARLESR